MSGKGRFTAELVGLVGLEATRQLIAVWGGQHLYFPETVPADHPLALEVGLHQAERLSQRFGGLRLLIPLGYAFSQRERNRAIREAHAAGATVPDLVRRFHLCERTIYYVLAKAPPSATLQADSFLPQSRQLRLF